MQPPMLHPRHAVSALLAGHPAIIPVLHVENPDHAEPLLGALVDAGIRIVEVTLRSACGLDVIRRMVAAGTEAVIGAGTVTTIGQFAQVADAGARFAVSPALTASLAEAARRQDLPYMPGVTTPSEALAAREHGFRELKFFPFELAGGVKWLRHVEPLYPDIRFCPTGGIDARNSREVLGCANVFAVGGAYPCPKPLIDAADWAAIGALAEEAVQAVARESDEPDGDSRGLAR